MSERKFKWVLPDLDAESGVPFDVMPSEKDALILKDLLQCRWRVGRTPRAPAWDLCEFMCNRLGLGALSSERDIDEALKRELFRIERLRIILEVHGLTQFEESLLGAKLAVVNGVLLVKQAKHTAALVCDEWLTGTEKNPNGDLKPPAKRKRLTAEQREWLDEIWHLNVQATLSPKLVEMKKRSKRLHCVVCLDKERSCCYVPCGHKCVCADCARHPSCATRCPICKAEGKPLRVFDV